MKSHLAALLAGAVLVAVLARLPEPAVTLDDARLAVEGHEILTRSCMRCHAIGTAGASPHPQAPPFRGLHRKYPVANLAEALAEGISTGHPDMPEFTFSADEIAAILAYLDSIADTPRSGR